MRLVDEAGKKRPMAGDDHFANGTSVFLDRTLLALSAVTTAVSLGCNTTAVSVSIPAGSDIAVLRMANVTFTIALSWICSFLVVRGPLDGGLAACRGAIGRNRQARIGQPLPLAARPSYSALTSQSLMRLLADRPGRIRRVLGRVLVGVGGWCCFTVRPTPRRPLPSSLRSMSSFVPKIAAVPHSIRCPTRSCLFR